MSRQSILSWIHYRILLQVFSKEARDWYEQEALTGSWSVRVLQRNVVINTLKMNGKYISRSRLQQLLGNDSWKLITA